jgi:ABC-type lipoprotein release transport system permease subunit
MFEIVSLFAGAGVAIGVLQEIVTPMVTQGFEFVKSVL